MFLEEILEVGIGLIFMWLVLSIASMQLQEWVANIFKWRANDLEGAIYRLLSDEETADKFYRHPLIKSLTKEPTERLKNMSSRSNKMAQDLARQLTPKPSYIPANKFAMALFDIVMTAGTEASVIQNAIETVKSEILLVEEMSRREAAEEALEALTELAKKAAHTRSGASTLAKLREEVDKFTNVYPELKPTIDSFFDVPASTAKTDETLLQLRRGATVIGLSNPELQSSLNSLLLGIEGFVTAQETSVAIARKNIESWFNDSMSRLSGWYKRKAQLVSFIIGLVLALMINVDSIALATSLWREPTIRQALVAKADAFELNTSATGSPGQAIRDFRSQFEGLNIPMGWTFDRLTTLSSQQCSFTPQAPGDVFGFYVRGNCWKPSTADVGSNGWYWMFAKFAGLLMSGLAAAQGAPFWFDILKKLINVRGTGSNPSEAKG